MRYTKNRLWRGKKRLALSFLGKRISIIDWALGLKGGDYVATCEGCNRRVKEINTLWINEGRFKRCKPNKTLIVYEVEVIDSNDNSHYCPGGGCVFPKQSVEEINAYYLECGRMLELHPNWLDGWVEMRANLLKKIEAVQTGQPIVDEFGEFLPKFDHASQILEN